MDIAQGEMVEKELDAMIERGSRKGEVDPDEGEAPWQESVRRYNARLASRRRAEWCEFHKGGQAALLRSVLEAAVARHEEAAAALEDA